MGILSLASGASAWRGYEYYKDKKVGKIEKTTDNDYKSVVRGTGSEPYQVTLNLAHGRKSTCNCPHAHGRMIVCKHMVAVFFELFPQEAKNYIKEVEEYEVEQERQEHLRIEEIRKYVYGLSKAELRQELLNCLLEDEWHY